MSRRPDLRARSVVTLLSVFALASVCACSSANDPKPGPSTPGAGTPAPEPSSHWKNTKLPPLVVSATFEAPARRVDQGGRARSLARGKTGGIGGGMRAPMAPGGIAPMRDAGAERAVPAGGDPGIAGDDRSFGTPSDAPGTDRDEAAPGAETPRETTDDAEPRRSPAPQPSALKAGTRDDNARFDDYLGYYHGFTGNQVVRFDITERYVVKVRDRNGRHVPNARVEVGIDGHLLFTGVTDAYGAVNFYPRGYAVAKDATQFELVVRALGAEHLEVKQRDPREPDADWIVTLDDTGAVARRIPAAVPVNVAFLVDTTGSMGDEIQALRSTLDTVVQRLSAIPGNPQLNYGLVLYRDRTDSYVTEVHDFVPELATFRKTLAAVGASGGGDTPEDVQQGLDAAMNKLSWSPREGLNLCFLIGDARPHLYQDQPHYVQSAATAVQKGVKVFSLAASGLSDTGEFIFRQIAHLTRGRFIFLTYGANDATPHHVGRAGKDYQSNRLDDVIVREIASEVKAFVADEITILPARASANGSAAPADD